PRRRYLIHDRSYDGFRADTTLPVGVKAQARRAVPPVERFDCVAQPLLPLQPLSRRERVIDVPRPPLRCRTGRMPGWGSDASGPPPNPPDSAIHWQLRPCSADAAEIQGLRPGGCYTQRLSP